MRRGRNDFRLQIFDFRFQIAPACQRESADRKRNGGQGLQIVK